MIKHKGAKWVITLLLLFLCPMVWAETQSVFFFSPTCVEAQKHIAALRLNKAELLLAQEAKDHPNNAAVALLQNSILFYRMVTVQDFSGFKSLESSRDSRLQQAKKIPTNSPFHLYAQSEIHLQWGFIKIFHQEYVGAMLEFKNAYQMANQNLEKFPDFKPSLKTVGMFKALLGSTPKNYKWILSVAGLKGNFEQGMSEMESYLKKDYASDFIIDKQLAVFYYGLFSLNFGDKQAAWEFCKQHTNDYPTNLMSCYLRAFTASKVAQNDEAIKVLQNRPKGAEYENFYLLDYLLGQCKLNRLDEDADQPLKKFVSFFKGKQLVSDAYRRLSWYYLIHNDQAKYKTYRELSLRNGSSDSEEEKYIKNEIASGQNLDVIMLRARLLFDGGYYSKAEEVLKLRNPDLLKTDYQKLEYNYRLGRIYQEQNKLSKATDCFKLVIKMAPLNTPYYFAPNACLQMGIIYKKMGFTKIAASHLKNVSNYTKAEYLQSISFKAANELEDIEKQ